MHKVQFRRLVRRHSLVGPFYTCKVLAFAIVLALNVAVLSLELTRTQVSALSLRLTKLSDAAARANYLVLLNLTVVYISPHHYGVADVLGLSLRLYQQVHRVAGLLSLCLTLFSSTVTLAGDPRGAMTTEEGRSGLMMIGCVAALAVASLVKPFAYEMFLKLHELSAALLAYLLLSRLLADPSFGRLPLYIYGGVAGLLNACFICRYGYYNFAAWNRPRLTCSEIAASKTHDRRWFHLELKVSRRIHVKPGQYISVWIPGVQLLSSHPFATTTETSSEGTVFHMYVHSRGGMTKTLMRQLLSSAMADSDLDKQTVVLRAERKQGPITQSKQTMSRSKGLPQFALFTGPHGRSVDHREFGKVVLVASGFGYWALDGYLKDMVRTGRADTKTQNIVLVYKGRTPIMIEEALNKRLESDTIGSADGEEPRLRVVFYPAERREDAVQDDGRFSDMDKLVRMKRSRPPQRRGASQADNNLEEVSRLEIANKGRFTFLTEADFPTVVVEDPGRFESDVKYKTKQSSFDHEPTNGTNTLILVSAENQVVEELKQVVATSKRRNFRLQVLDFIPAQSLESGDDEFAVRRVQPPVDARAYGLPA
ncbi:metalloreductase transmembrane component [Cordyceps javanica]|uniref:ferric-chelate reductase (NADPH) n=1 Tax=Cordyceps javanica TaxID=43265 RepID=A0A545UKE5_9HYPO|nr:metalloreductase transmembrane component [Cordyceps javanica]TQW01401.1 metalloreductase transmembrane component [Cordyceps javanica]